MRLTTTQVQLANSNSTNNNSTGPDDINIRHLKHLRPLYLTNMYNTALNTNTILQLWKRAIIIHIPKPNEDHNMSTNYQPISLLSLIPKIQEKTLLAYITENIPVIFHQHGLKHKHSTHTAFHNIRHQITKGFNNLSPLQRTATVVVALNMSWAFDTVNIHKLILTNIPNIFIKFIANYTKRQACTQYNGTLSKLKQINTEYHKMEFYPQHYYTFTPLTSHEIQNFKNRFSFI